MTGPEANAARSERLLRLAAEARRVYPRAGFSGVSSTAIQVLLALQVDETAKPKEIARELTCDRATVQKALGELAEKGYLLQEGSRGDRRGLRRGITKAGRRLLGDFIERTDQMYSE